MASMRAVGSKTAGAIVDAKGRKLKKAVEEPVEEPDFEVEEVEEVEEDVFEVEEVEEVVIETFEEVGLGQYDEPDFEDHFVPEPEVPVYEPDPDEVLQKTRELLGLD